MENNNAIYQKVGRLNDIVVTSDDFMNAYNGIKQCAERSVAYKEPIGSMLLAEGGLGKTTLCHTIVNQMPRSIKIEEGYSKTIIPAFYVEVPSPATVKSLALTMLQKLGDSTHYNGTTSYLTNRLSYLLLQCETKLVFLDEFHHLFDRTSKSTKINITIGNWIKTLVNETGISFCLVGLPEFADFIQVDSQIARRFPFHFKILPLSLGTKDDYGTIYPFLSEIARKVSTLQMSFTPSLDSYILGLQLFVATNGYHSYIMNLIRESMVIALQDNRNTITDHDFSMAWQLGITTYISNTINDPFNMPLAKLFSTLKGT